MLPLQIPIFPLPNVVLFPNVSLPLHIFEPRYREMVEHVLVEDRLIGMTLLREGHGADTAVPPVYSICCAGVIEHSKHMEDGRYNIMLRGLEKFKIRDEHQKGNYRQAVIDTIEEPCTDQELQLLNAIRTRLENLLTNNLKDSGANIEIPKEMTDIELVNTIAQYYEFDMVEKQFLLERQGAHERGQALIELLQMQHMTTHRHYKHGVQ